MCPHDDDLPADPDLASTGTAPSGATTGDHRQALVLHRHPGFVALVFAGGVVGTGSRSLLTEALSPWHGLGNAGATLIINLTGCLLLGFLLEALARRGPDLGRRRLLRLGVGTGFCGGFTTYSTLALDAAIDLQARQPWHGIGYAALSLLLGLMITGLGVLLGARLVRSDPGAGATEPTGESR